MKDSWFEIPNRRLWLFLFALGMALYGRTMYNGYAIDDYLVSENLEMVDKGIAGIPEILTSYYGITDLGNPFEYRPISRITFAIERSIWGENLGMSHLINVVLYVLLTITVFYFLTYLIGSEQRKLIIIASVLFLFHPIHTEVVCSLKNRDEILSLLFALLSGILLVRYLNSKSVGLLFSSMLLFVLSLATKPGQLPLAGVLVLGMLLFQKRSFKELCIAGLPYFFLTGIYLATVIHFLPQWWRVDYAYEENSLFFLSGFWERLPTAFVAFYHYLKLVVIPHPLSFFYGYDHISVAQWSDGLVIASAALLGLLGLAFILSIKRHPVIAFGIGIFLMGISPFLNVIGPVAGIVAERWLLLASLGFSLILAYGIDILAEKITWKHTRLVALAIILLAYGTRTITRIPDWKSSKTLVYNDVQVVPRSFVPNFLAARWRVEDATSAKTQDEWKQHLTKALKSNEVLAEICVHKANYLNRCAEQNMLLGKADSAAHYAAQLYSLNQGDSIYDLKALNILQMLGNAKIGLPLAIDAVENYPTNPDAHLFLGQLQLADGDTLAAINSFEKVSALREMDTEFIAWKNQLKQSHSESKLKGVE